MSKRERRRYKRWAVLVRYCHSKDHQQPFLAGRYFGAEGQAIADASIPTATFATRREARQRADKIRSRGPGWRITAVPVRVVVSVVLECKR